MIAAIVWDSWVSAISWRSLSSLQTIVATEIERLVTRVSWHEGMESSSMDPASERQQKGKDLVTVSKHCTCLKPHNSAHFPDHHMKRAASPDGQVKGRYTKTPRVTILISMNAEPKARSSLLVVLVGE